MKAMLFAIRRFVWLPAACLIFLLIAAIAVAADQSLWNRFFGTAQRTEDTSTSDYDSAVQRLIEEKNKFEELLKKCDDIGTRLSDDYNVAYAEYDESKNESLRTVLFEELKITKKRQLALPKYRDECNAMIIRINSLRRRLRQEQIIPANIANVYEDINKTIENLGNDFFDFATKYDASDVEAERLILSQPQHTAANPQIVLQCSPSVEMKFVLIPAGIFQMGSPLTEEGRNEDEVQHRVTISKSFYMGMHEVTQAQYQAVMGINPSDDEFEGDNLPVVRVGWDDAVEFCRKLSEKTGHTARLPTEAEWEYACRAGTTTPFSFGETIGTDQVNYFFYEKPSRSKIMPVGSFPANQWGLFDMHGNIWEWCADWYSEYPKNDMVIDPKGSLSGTDRVLRGGAWLLGAEFCRSATRYASIPEIDDGSFPKKGLMIGFRVLCEK